MQTRRNPKSEKEEGLKISKMTNTSGEEKAIQVISFSGQKKDWPVWEEKFLANARH